MLATGYYKPFSEKYKVKYFGDQVIDIDRAKLSVKVKFPQKKVTVSFGR